MLSYLTQNQKCKWPIADNRRPNITIMTKILIIENDKNIRDTIQEILLLKAYKVLIASNSIEGISKAIFDSFTLFILHKE
jgi:DNA-binding NtrC family response regulator